MISADTKFEPGIYNLPNGISIISSNVILDINHATISGDIGSKIAIKIANNLHNIQIMNGRIEGYEYGIQVMHCSNISIQNNHLHTMTKHDHFGQVIWLS